MGNYNWSNDDIKRKIELIKSFEDKEKYRNDIITLNGMLSKDIEERHITGELQSELDCHQSLLRKWAEDFVHIVEENGNDIGVPSFGFLYLSDDELLSIVHDFYKTRIPQVYETFEKEFAKKDYNLRIKEALFHSSAVTYHIKCLNQSYINIEKSNSIFDAVNLAHEYGHAVGFHINNELASNDNFIIIDDLDGEYFELEFINWLIANNIHTEEAVLAKMFVNHNMYCKARYLQHLYNIQKSAYLNSYLTSIELSNADNKDELFIRLITHNPANIANMLNVLNDFIELNNHADSYQKVLKKEATKYFC